MAAVGGHLETLQWLYESHWMHVWTQFYQTHPCWVVPRACLLVDLQTVPQSVEGKSLDGTVPWLDLLYGVIE